MVSKLHRRLRPLRNYTVGHAGTAICRAWIATLRIRWIGDFARRGDTLVTPVPGIYAFWHQRLIGMTATCRVGCGVLVSRSSDGEMIAQVLSRLGFRPLRGSTRRGGSRAVLEALREDPDRFTVAITPDGPKGPSGRFQSGAIYLASRKRVPIYPMTVTASRCYRLPTWEELLVPAPFSRVLARLGDPIHVPADLDRDGIEGYAREAEKALQDLTAATDRDFESLYRNSARFSALPER